MDMSRLRHARISTLEPNPVSHPGGGSLLRDPISRRTFFRAGGAAAVGAAARAFALPAHGFAQPGYQPVPIPGGSLAIQEIAGGQLFHVYGPSPAGPAALDLPEAEPATITDFNGAVGLAYLNGMVTRRNTMTGETSTVPFANTDMRFMKGIFRGSDGQIHDGAFAFV